MGKYTSYETVFRITTGRYAKIIQHLALVSVITSVRLTDFKFTVPEGDRLFSSQSSLAPFLD